MKTDQPPPASVIRRFLALDVLEQGENDFAEEIGEAILLPGFCLTSQIMYLHCMGTPLGTLWRVGQSERQRLTSHFQLMLCLMK